MSSVHLAAAGIWLAAAASLAATRQTTIVVLCKKNILKVAINYAQL